MKRIAEMTVGQLVEQFTEIALAQDDAILMDDNKKFNKLFSQMEEVKQELKRRHGDQRRALLRLYEHPNAQVRLKAAIATLAVAPEAARRLLRNLAEYEVGPQKGDAGMMLVALERGEYKPT